MSEVVLGLGAACGASVIAWAWRGRRLARRTRERLHEHFAVEEPEERASTGLSPAVRRKQWLPWCAGVVTFLALRFAVGLGPAYAFALGVVVTVLTHIVELQVATRRIARIESELADAIDLMVASLSAGAGLMEAFDSATSESRGLLREELSEVVGRVRCGDPPAEAYEDLSQRVPLETFRLFTFALAVHGEVGGSLAPALATVGRSIRDSIEVGRKVSSQSTQAQASVVGILCITWFLGLMMWRTNPEAFEEFLSVPMGSTLVAGGITLQAIGLVWITRMARIRF